MERSENEFVPMMSRRRLAWTRYWANGGLHSLETSFVGNYAKAIGAFWQGEFALCASTEHILDIGCGNGPLAKLLIDLDPNAIGPTWTGIDLANPSPDWLARQSNTVKSRLHFRGGVPAEDLPFPDQSFDVVISQFGIEYTDLSRSQLEAVRVLKNSGRMALVVHHRQSLPVMVSKQELTHLRFLENQEFLDLTAQMIPLIAKLANPDGSRELTSDSRAMAIRKRFDEATLAIEQRAKTEPIPDLLTDARLCSTECFQLAVSVGSQAAFGHLAAFKVALSDSRFRLDEVVQNALDEADIASLQERFISLNREPMSFARIPLTINDQIFGWIVKVRCQ